MTAKRSLLREARTHMEATFRGGGELAKKVRECALKVYSALCKSEFEQARELALEAYGIVDTEGQRVPGADGRLAMEALDIAFFLVAFAGLDEEDRKVAWRIWDARDRVRGDLYDYLSACRQAIGMMRDGASLQEAIATIKESKGLDVTPFMLDYDTAQGI